MYTFTALHLINNRNNTALYLWSAETRTQFVSPILQIFASKEAILHFRSYSTEFLISVSQRDRITGASISLCQKGQKEVISGKPSINVWVFFCL